MFCKWIHEFNCLNSRVSVREFTGFDEQIWCVDTCLTWNHECFTWWHVPVKLYPVWLVSNSFKTCDNEQNTCIHVNTHENRYWWSSTNYEPVWHVPTGSEMVPCLLGNPNTFLPSVFEPLYQSLLDVFIADFSSTAQQLFLRLDQLVKFHLLLTSLLDPTSVYPKCLCHSFLA